jgi:hypothetical protein
MAIDHGERGRTLLQDRGLATPRAPDYVVALDPTGEAERHGAGLLLVDILSAADIEAACRPRGPGEDENWLNRLTDEDGVSSIDEQRALARGGHDATHRLTRTMRGRYPEVVIAVARSLTHHGHRLLSMTETPEGACLEAYIPRPTFGGPNGRLSVDIVLADAAAPAGDPGATRVEGRAECKGVGRSMLGDILRSEVWKEGRQALERVIDDAERLLAGEAPLERGWLARFSRST